MSEEGVGAIAQVLIIVLLAVVINAFAGSAKVFAFGLDSSFLISATIILALLAALVYAVQAIIVTIRSLVAESAALAKR